MRLYRKGEPAELTEGISAHWVDDRVYVKTPDGVFTGVAVQKGDSILVSFRGQTFEFDRTLKRQVVESTASGKLTAPMPGLIVEVLAQEGASLPKGAKLVILEAMKTQLPTVMPFDGRVVSVRVKAGEQVEQDALLVEVAPMETTR